MSNTSSIKLTIPEECLKRVKENAEYLQKKIDSGLVVYGVNTGFGGSADVRWSDTAAVQESLVTFLNAGKRF